MCILPIGCKDPYSTVLNGNPPNLKQNSCVLLQLWAIEVHENLLCHSIESSAGPHNCRDDTKAPKLQARKRWKQLSSPKINGKWKWKPLKNYTQNSNLSKIRLATVVMIKASQTNIMATSTIHLQFDVQVDYVNIPLTYTHSHSHRVQHSTFMKLLTAIVSPNWFCIFFVAD